MIDLAWIFHWFCARVFVMCSAIKRESSLISEIFVPDIVVEYMLQFRENEFHENLSKIINFLVGKFTLQNWSVLILVILELRMDNLLHLSKEKKTRLH